MASSSTPSSSTTTLTKKYEVFLSFRGLDTRQGFTSHLYDALCRKNIKTFRDDDELRRGVEISPALLRAIEESKIAVVIFSENYASSEWCLSELAEIIKRMKLKELIVMPVFYNVDPSDVQELKGSYECSFATYEEIGRVGIFSWFSWLLSVCNSCKKKELQEEVQKWREALTEASNQAGFDSSVIRPEAELVGEIVKTVWRELRSKYIPSSSDFEGLIGIHKRIEEVKELLCLDRKDVRKIIGIWGMGGVGKTTIARAVFKSISYKFDGACIIEKVWKRLEDGGSEQLLCDVLSKVLHEENPKLDTPIRPDIMEMLNPKKVFIVLDDVDTTQIHTISTLKAFVESLINQCGLGSRIIITSRDKDKLCAYDRMIYKVEGFNVDEALELFQKHANPTEDCMELSEKIVNYAKGNPLALTVSGLSLKGKNKQEWESALNDLPEIVNSRIFNLLKISYDGLDKKEKKLFLDLACFGDLYNYHGLLKEEFLDGLKFSLSGLVAKSLITRHIRTGDIEMHDILKGHKRTGDIEMHDLLQEMGREIVCGESPEEPGKRSRLWERNDVIWTLEKNTGTYAVEVISLYLSGPKDIHLRPEVFDNMHKLRFLLFVSSYGSNKVHLSKSLNCLPDELMILCWPGYPLTTLPSNFNPKKLVKLDLSGSNIEQLWEETKHATEFPKLKWLILRYCKHLTRIPNLSDFPMLEEVDLRGCDILVDLTSSVQQLNNLRDLDLSYCSCLTRIPNLSYFPSLEKLNLSFCGSLADFSKFPLISRSIERLNLSGTAIEEAPSSIQSLTNLTELDLSTCTRLKHISTSICKLKSLSTLDITDCSQLETFPEILETMEFLKSLDLSGSAIKVLPPSIEHLNGLQLLRLSDCRNLEMLPSSICNVTSLEDLDLSNCSKLDKLPDNLGNLKSLKCLNVSGSAVGQLPSSITCLENLEGLDFSGCSLMEIPEDIGCLSSLKKLWLGRNMFESLPKSIKQLSKLEYLLLRDCKKLRSIPDLPEGLKRLEAMDCDQLCQVPDASEFVRCINSKSHDSTYYHHRVDFIFINCLNLIKAVSNVFEESLQIMQRTEKGSGKPPNEFSIYLPGNKIPEWFSSSYQSLESSVNFQVLRNDLVNRKFMGFALCAVWGFDDYNSTRKQYILGVDCGFKAYYDHIKISNGVRSYNTNYTTFLLNTASVDSDHMLLGYCSFYSRNPKKLPAGDSDYVDISIRFKIRFEIGGSRGQLKRCAVHPIYAKEPIEIIGATIQEIGETSGRRSDRSDENDEEVEPHPNRICTQAINTP